MVLVGGRLSDDSSRKAVAAAPPVEAIHEFLLAEWPRAGSATA